MNNSYLRFLQNISQTTTHLQLNKDLSPTAIFLLNEIAVKDFEGQPLIVSQAMEFRALGSPATLHRKIHGLREAGMISVESVGTDRRTKYLHITQAARDYFQIKNDAILQALESK
jgi:DNA-binding MarR family transcriptional regulator